MSRKKPVDIVKCLTYALVPMSLVYLFIGFNQGFNAYDEGLAVYGATSVLRGETLYTDFWTGYGPAQFYLLAALFKLFGTYIIVARIATVCSVWLASVAAYMLARRLTSPGWALLAWTVIVLRSFGIVHGYPSPMPNILVLCFLSCLCMFNFLSSRRTYWLAASGLLAGLVAVFRHDFAAYVMLAEMFVGTIFILTGFHTEPASISRRLASLIKLQACYVLSAAVVIVPVAILILSRVPKSDMVFVLITVPLKLYAKYFTLPYPMPPGPQHIMSLRSYAMAIMSGLPFWFPVIVYGIAAVVIARRAFRSGTRQLSDLLPPMLILILGVEFWNYARIRSDLPHVLPTFIVSVIVFGALLQHLPKAGRLRVPVYVLTALLCLCLVFIPLREKAAMARASIGPKGFTFAAGPGRGIYPGNQYAQYEEAIRFVQERTVANEKIFVGCVRHDSLRTNDAAFYVLSGRRSASRYVELHRAVACTAPCQKEIVSGLIRNRVRCIVLRQDNATEPNASRLSSGVTILDDFIRKNYAPVAEFGGCSVWWTISRTGASRS